MTGPVGRAAAAEMSLGTRAALAGVGLCSTCRHPVRLHGDLGCAKGECECGSTGADLRAGVATVPARTVPPSAAELAHLDVVCTCEHRRTEHTVTGSHVQCKVCRCGGFTPGGPDAPVAPPSKPTPPPVAAAPAPAVAPAAPAGPVGEPPAPRPVAAEPPPWLPGTGVPYVKPTPAPPVAATPDVDVARQVDAIVAAGKLAARKRPRLQTARPAVPTAHGSRAVVGEPDAVEEVAAAPPPAATAEPHTPGAGWARAKAELGDMVPDLTDEDEARADEIIAAASSWVPGRPAAVAVHWDPPPACVRLSPPPLDFGPLLAAALYVSARWYCPRCHQWPLNPGACPGCHKTLQAVYHVTIPRSTT